MTSRTLALGAVALLMLLVISGLQPYDRDTQSDMAFALVGGVSSLLLLSKIHDRQIQSQK